MRKSVWIFLVAIILPSAVLGWLALRSAEQQKIILERQTTELYQRETDSLAAAARALVDEQRRGFAEAVRLVLAEAKPEKAAVEFAGRLSNTWPRKAIGFSLGEDGRVLSPAPPVAGTKPSWSEFLRDHARFLDNSIPAPVYNVQVETLTQPEQLRRAKGDLLQSVFSAKEEKSLDVDKKLPARERAAPASLGASASPTQAGGRATPPPKAASKEKYNLPLAAPQAPAKREPSPSPPVAPPASSAPSAAATPAEGDTRLDQELRLSKDLAERSRPLPPPSGNFRSVQPQQIAATADHSAVSSLLPETAEFGALSEGQNEGILARFVQDKLTLIFWLRPPQAPNLIFGCAMDAADLADLWPQIMPEPRYSSRGGREFILALLDERARPVIVWPAGEVDRDWKHPFVASEIGEALPHWEATLHLIRPEQLQENALGLRRTLTFLIVGMLGAIALGGWLVVADARRQFALAQQKTDFVSNVSHELKTPLTSIRMFAELMLGGRADAAKLPQYLRIIMVEAERLTRLINNVLDFAKLERRQKRFDKKALDLHELIARVWEGQELHLRESGFTTKWEAAPGPYRVLGDEDALAQILVNLLANAEKYSSDRKEIQLHTYFDDHHVCISVLDRGLGVPAGSEKKIFEAFYRAHDSLSSGIQGSGLGLTLAIRLAEEHGGTITYRARDGGGSAFTLRVATDAVSTRPASGS